MSVLHGIRSVGCVVVLSCAAAHAAPDTLGPPRLEVDTLQQWDPSRRDSGPAWRYGDAVAMSLQRPSAGVVGRSALSDDGLRARWWWGRGAIEVGAGADWLAPAGASSVARPLTQVVGVRAALSARTRLVYEAESAPLWRGADSGIVNPRTARVALEFKSKSPVGDLRNGLLRVQLSGDAALQFKPRSGGLQVMYRERF